MDTNGVTATGHTMLFFSSVAQRWIKCKVLLKFHLICTGNLQVVPDCSHTDTNNCPFKGPECQPCLFSPLLFSSTFCWEPPRPPGMTSSADANAPSVCTELHCLFQLKGSQHHKWICPHWCRREWRSSSLVSYFVPIILIVPQGLTQFQIKNNFNSGLSLTRVKCSLWDGTGNPVPESPALFSNFFFPGSQMLMQTFIQITAKGFPL